MSQVYAQESSYSDNYSMEVPTNPISQYARIMLEHTKRQLQLATSSAERRSSHSTLTPQSSLGSDAGESPV